MTQQIYQWMENLAYFFIFLSAVLNFMPDNSYRKYVQYFMGILLMLLLLSPILQFLNMDERIETSFYDYLQEEESRQLQQWEEYAQELEEKYNVKMYQEEGMTQ
jgi:stage III sporulation protein AF